MVIVMVIVMVIAGIAGMVVIGVIMNIILPFLDVCDRNNGGPFLFWIFIMYILPTSLRLDIEPLSLLAICTIGCDNNCDGCGLPGRVCVDMA